MANKNVQKFAWLLLAILGFGNGVLTLTFYEQSTLSILIGAMQIGGGIILLIVLHMVFKKKENGKSI
ncbi:hypothetical protein QTL97_16525 [Sporosarcina thermotolerans]|uniref:Uncharacterized protein n=1 Tax=Sporosarcina thermotolerans TaxID=633404 RepID=A0AAW9AFQ8_9BACL|nr:hypothetical protein [Sporosarcina thermotolerans]MDW0118536.1 hypothetical protein [Sporosarcina thermotolerans]